MSGPGILTVQFQVSPEGEALVNRWYDEVHIAERLAVPGFRAIRRFRSLDEPLEHFTMWDVDDVDWPFQPQYKAYPTELWTERLAGSRTKSVRTGWEEIATSVPPPSRPPGGAPDPGIRMVRMDVPEDRAADFNAWYDEDHIPELMRRPEYLGIRRFKERESSRYLALWFLTDCGIHQRSDFVPAPASPRGRAVAEYRTFVQHSSWREIATVASGPTT